MAQRCALSRRSFLGASAFGVLGLGACGSTPPAAPKVDITVPEAILAEAAPLRGGQMGFLSTRLYTISANEAVDRSIKTFADATGTTVETNLVNTETGDLIAKLDAEIKAGNGREMAFFPDTRFIAQLHSLGLIEDVTDVVTELTAAWGEPASVTKYSCVFDGRWFAIPYQFIGIGSFARRDWFEEKGIPLRDSYTWEEMRDIALEISDPSRRRFGWGKTVNRSADGNGFIEDVVNCYGGSMTSNDGRKVTFNSPETIEALSFLVDVYTNPKYRPMLPPGVESWTDTSNNENWLAGVIGYTSNTYTMYSDSKATGNPVHQVTHAFVGCTGPAVERPISVGQAQALVLFKGAKNPDLAKVLAKYLVSGTPLLNVAQAATGQALPAWAKVWDSDPYYTTGDSAFPAIRKVAQQTLPITSATGNEFPQSPSSGRQAALQAYVLTDMMQAAVQGTPVPEAVATAHQRIVQIFEQQGIRQ